MRWLIWVRDREVRRVRAALAGARRANAELAGQVREMERAMRRAHETSQELIRRYRDRAVSAEERAERAERQLREVDGQ